MGPRLTPSRSIHHQFLAGLGIAPASNDLFIAPMPIPCSSDP